MMKIPNTEKKIMRSGFTLVELLLYMGLMTIFLGVLTDIFVTTLDSKKESEATSAVEQDGRFILSRLSYDFATADSINTPAALGQTDNSLVLTIGPSTNTYSVSANNLTLNGEKLNSSETKISNLFFQKLGNVSGKQTVQIKFTITSTTQRPKGPEVRNYQTTLGIR